MITCQKHLFDLDPEFTYLNGAYMSPQMKAVHAVGMDTLSKKNQPWKVGLEDFFEPVEKLKRQFAELINVAEPQRIALIPSVSYGISNVTRNLKFRSGQNIILAGEQFPSNYYAWKRLADEHNLTLRIIAAPEDSNQRGKEWNQKILEAIDNETLAVSIGHVHWADGTRFDLKSIRNRTNDVDAYLIIDGTQSVGALKFDNSIFEVDALICGGYKWLMGAYGLGLAYFGPKFDNGIPIEENWIHRHNSQDFKNLVNYQEEYRPFANRYSVGEVSNFIYVSMLSKALEKIKDWGTENIQSYCHSISDHTINALRTKGCWIEEIDFRVNHLFGIRLPESIDIEKLKSKLQEKQIIVSYRGTAIRVSPHVYNDEAEFKKFLDCF